MAINLRRFVGLLLLLVSLVMLLWSIWPNAAVTHKLEFSGQDMQAIIELSLNGNSQYEYLPYTLQLSWPEKARTGEIQEVKLVFAAQEYQHEQPSASKVRTPGGSQPGSQVEERSLLLEARLEAPNLVVLPSGNIGQKLVPSQPVNFSWRIQPQQAQVYRGTIWVYLRPLGDEADASKRQVLAAHEFSITGIQFLGLNSLALKLLGSVGAAVGAVLALDKIVLDLLSAIQKRASKKE